MSKCHNESSNSLLLKIASLLLLLELLLLLSPTSVPVVIALELLRLLGSRRLHLIFRHIGIHKRGDLTTKMRLGGKEERVRREGGKCTLA